MSYQSQNKEEKAMKSIQKRTLIALIFIASIVTPIMIESVNAQTVTYHTSYIYVTVDPAKLGVGQQLLIVAFTKDMPADIGEASGAVPSPDHRAGWDGITFNITKPDGSSTIIPLSRTDSVGSTYLSYIPDQVGAYSIIAYFPATWKNQTVTTPYSYQFYSAAYSIPITINVQTESVAERQQYPAPVDYWTRPVSAMLHNYYAVEGNWLSGAANQYPLGGSGGVTAQFSYSNGPGSAHILWTKPYYMGGIMDDRTGSYAIEQFHYQGMTWSPSVILDGKLYYTPRYTAHGAQGCQIVDLYTGATMYLNYSDTVPSFGQILNYESPNQHGGLPYLYRTASGFGTGNGTVYEMIDAHTYAHITYIANVSTSGTQVYGTDGSLLRYNIVNYGNTTNPNYRMTVYNMTDEQDMLGGTIGTTGYWQWRPAGGSFGGNLNTVFSYGLVHNAANDYTANFSIPTPLGPRNSVSNQTASIQVIRQDEYCILGSAGVNNENGEADGYWVAFSLKPEHLGESLWSSSITPPYSTTSQNVSVSLTGCYPRDSENVTVVYSSTALLTRWFYDAKTGQLLATSPTQPQADYYGFNTNCWKDELLLSTGYGGVLIAYDLTTGLQAWNYTAAGEYLGDTAFGNYPMNIGAISNDGKIYVGTGSHSPGPIMDSGNVLQCINASNGALLWNFPVFGISMPSGNAGGYWAIADGRLIAYNGYDNQIYCFGRGPSATAVSAPQLSPMLGSSVTITGTVTDQTLTGRRNTNDEFDFSLKGTPAISDSDQSAWMEHLYQQAPVPTNATGVPVSVYTIDPNGNYVSIGDTTTDMYGNFGISYTPAVPGTYQIFATFKGSEAYGPSSSSTFLTVDKPVTTNTPAPTAIPESLADAYFIPATIGVILTIIIVGAVIVIMLKKRP
jgi:hypothetical protein